MTYDVHTDHPLHAAQDVQNMDKHELIPDIPDGPRDIRTWLLHRTDLQQSGPAGTVHAAVGETSLSSSTALPPVPPFPRLDRGSASGLGPGDRVPHIADAPPSTHPAPRPPRPPRHERRAREVRDVPTRAWRDVGTSPEDNPDWRDFNIQDVLRLFRARKLGAVRLSLRKLHVRWWHATSAQMRRILHQSGVPREVLDMVPDIVDTCSVCRAWARPGPDHQVNIDLPDTFNQQVEADIVFIDYGQQKNIPVLHFVDRCTRWQAAVVLKTKNEQELLDALDKLWVGIQAPPRNLFPTRRVVCSNPCLSKSIASDRASVLSHVQRNSMPAMQNDVVPSCAMPFIV